MSLQYHPDKNQGDAAAQEMFQRVARAYEVLSDPDKRQTYDLEGEEGLAAEEQGRPSSPFGTIMPIVSKLIWYSCTSRFVFRWWTWWKTTWTGCWGEH